MKHSHNIKEPKVALTDQDIESLLRKVAAEEGACVPQTLQELEALDAALAGRRRPAPPDFTEVLRMIRSEPGIERVKTIVFPIKFGNQAAAGLAMAARNGGEISESVRTRMNADRMKAEDTKL